MAWRLHLHLTFDVCSFSVVWGMIHLCIGEGGAWRLFSAAVLRSTAIPSLPGERTREGWWVLMTCRSAVWLLLYTFFFFHLRDRRLERFFFARCVGLDCYVTYTVSSKSKHDSSDTPSYSVQSMMELVGWKWVQLRCRDEREERMSLKPTKHFLLSRGSNGLDEARVEDHLASRPIRKGRIQLHRRTFPNQLGRRGPDHRLKPDSPIRARRNLQRQQFVERGPTSRHSTTVGVRDEISSSFKPLISIRLLL
jgi:hypothetical protein